MDYLNFYYKKLCKFSHRGAGTDNEKKAAKFIKEEYIKLNIDAKYFDYKIYKDSLFRHAFAISSSALILLWLLFFNFINKFTFLFYLIIFLLHLRMPLDMNVFLRKFSRTISRSVYGKLKPEKEIKLTIVLVGHFDTCRKTLFVKHYAKLLS